MNVNLDNLRQAVDDRDETVQQFCTFIDELMAVLAQANIVLPRGYRLRYFPSKEYTFTLGNESYRLTHNFKDISVLLIFAEALREDRWLEYVRQLIERQSQDLKSGLEKGREALVGITSQ